MNGDLRQGLCVTGNQYQKKIAFDAESILTEDAEREDVTQILDDLEKKPIRLPHVSVICDCPRRLPKQAVTASKNADNSDSDVEDFGLDQVVKALLLYEKQPSTRKHKGTLLRLVSSFRCTSHISDDDLNELVRLCQHSDSGLQEAACKALLEVTTSKQDNLHSVCRTVDILFNVLASEVSSQVHISVSKVLEFIFRHDFAVDKWQDMLIATGICLVVDHLSDHYKPEVRFACGKLLSALCHHASLLPAVLSSAFPTINSFKKMSSSFQMLYSELFSEILSHQEAVPIIPDLMDDIINSARLMLKRGPCGPQKQAVQLMSRLCCTQQGIECFMSDGLLPLVMSAFIDSDCRSVRESAIECIGQLMSGTKTHTQRDILLTLDDFFHEHLFPDQPCLAELAQTSPGKYSMEVLLRMKRAIEKLTQELVSVLNSNAKMEVFADIILSVKLDRSLDWYESRLSTIGHVTSCLGHMTRLSVLRVKVNIDSVRDTEIRELKELRKTLHRLNFSIVIQLLENGACALLDVLHHFTQQLASDNAVQTKSAWSVRGTAGRERTSLETKFTHEEVKLIFNLLETLELFAKCSAEQSTDLESVMKTEHKNYKRSLPISILKKEYEQAGVATDNGYLGNILSDSDGEDEGDLMLRYREAFAEAVAPLQKQTRRLLFEAGLINAVAPLLGWECHSHIQDYLVDIVTHMVQPLEESAYIPPQQNNISANSKRRPASAIITKKDREALLDKAFIKMTPNVREFISDALKEGETTQTNVHYNKFARSTRQFEEKHNSRRPTSAKSVSSCSSARKIRPQSSRPKSSASRKTNSNPSLSEQTRPASVYKFEKWKPEFVVQEPASYQCRKLLLDKTTPSLLQMLFSSEVKSRKSSLCMLYQLVKHSEHVLLAKLAQAGLMSKLVDFLRVNDTNEELLLMALQAIHLAIIKDARLNQLLGYHGGLQLLITMATTAEGMLKHQVTKTLKVATKSGGLSLEKVGRCIQSAPPTRTANQMPDIWDKIQQRWEDEDRVTLMMRRYALF